MTFGLLSALIIFFPVVVLAASVLRRALTLPPHARAGGAACGNCGYAVRGLAETRCPECGSDLLHVGVVTPRLAAKHRGSGPAAALAWLILWPLLFLPLNAMVTSLLSTRIRAAGLGWWIESFPLLLGGLILVLGFWVISKRRRELLTDPRGAAERAADGITSPAAEDS